MKASSNYAIKHILLLIFVFSQNSCSGGLQSEADSVNDILTTLTEVMKKIKTDNDWKSAKETEVIPLVEKFDRLSQQLEEKIDSSEREERRNFNDRNRPLLKELRDELALVANQITANPDFTMGYDIKNAFRKLGDSGYLSDVSPKVEVGVSADKSYK